MGLGKVPASLGSPHLPLKWCVAWLHQGQVPWGSLVPSPGHIKPVQLLLAGLSGPHGAMLAMAVEHWAEGKLVCQRSHLGWAVRGDLCEWENAFTPCLGPERAKPTHVCQTARWGHSGHSSLGRNCAKARESQRVWVCVHSRVCMCRRASTVGLPLPLPPFLCRGFRSSTFHRRWKLGGKLKPDCDWKLM